MSRGSVFYCNLPFRLGTAEKRKPVLRGIGDGSIDENKDEINNPMAGWPARISAPGTTDPPTHRPTANQMLARCESPHLDRRSIDDGVGAHGWLAGWWGARGVGGSATPPHVHAHVIDYKP